MSTEMLKKLKRLKDKIERMTPDEVADLFEKCQEGFDELSDEEKEFLAKVERNLLKRVT